MGLETRPPSEKRPKSGADEAALLARPEREEPAPAATPPDLPDFAKKADDLEAIKKAVDDAASVGGGLWLSYLFVLFYLAVATGAVTHEDLFFERAVKLPFLTDIELPLVAFFFLAPILFIIVHAYTLLHLVMLTEKAKRFHDAVHDAERNVDPATRENLQWQLPSNIFIQFLIGPPGIRSGLFGATLRAIAWITLVIAPVLLLMMMQVQFLPFHSLFIIWTQRIALMVDLILLTWLWPKVLSGSELGGPSRASWTWPVLGFALSFGIVLFSWTVATFPGEWQEERLPGWPIPPEWDAWDVAEEVSLHRWIFASQIDPATGRRALPFSSTLVLPGLNLYDELKIDDPEKAKQRAFLFHARGRDLKGAIFDFATLPKIDFAAAQLQGARFRSARLEGASFGCVEDPQTVSSECAQLQGALLVTAQLQGASLEGAQLQGAALAYAQLQGASLDGAELQGASLNGAKLQGASLNGANLQGASLRSAQLQGASLELAALEATDLSHAYLWRTNRTVAVWPVKAIRMSDESWLPEWGGEAGINQSWDDKAYGALRSTLEESLPPGNLRDQALKRIESLDCSTPDKRLAPCDPSATPPPEAAAWLQALRAEAARVGDEAYADALTKTLKSLVCSSGDNAIHVVRGVFGFQNRLRNAGAAGADLIDDLTNKDSKNCPVAASLTDADRATLLQLKQKSEKARK